jgi:protein phosphatase 1B
MGAFLDKPKTEKYNESRVGGGLRYGLSSMQVRGGLCTGLWD